MVRTIPTEAEPSPELIAHLAQEVYAHDVLQLLINNISRFEFEVRSLDAR
jgi:calcium binding protein 39